MSTVNDHSADHAPPEDTSAEVAVVLDGCAQEDATAVFAALRASFPSDRTAEDELAEADDSRPMVWSATFDVSRTLGLPGPARLTEPVTITVQGGYRAVERMQDGLAEAFDVRVLGTASGDQEEEAQLRLENQGPKR